MLARTAVFVAFGLAALTFAAEGPKNLVENGDLESAIDAGGTIPKGWSLHARPADAYKTAIAQDGHGGKKSLLVFGDGEFAVVSTGGREIDPKLRYAARGFLKIEGEAGAKATIKFDYFDDKYNWVASTMAGEVTAGTKGWQAVAVTDRAGIDAPKAKNIAVSLALNGKGKAWFDDIELSAAPGKAETNLIYNGDFENFAGTRPASWWTGCAEGGKQEAAISTDKPKEGKHCLHFKGNADWAVATAARIKMEKGKTYTVTGFVRTRSGAAQIKIDYFEGDNWLGSTFGEDVIDNEWTEKAVSSTEDYPAATHIAATCVGTGDFEAFYDGIVVTAK
jgi:hypothetical protein